MATKARGGATAVCLEVGQKKVFASVLEWPGWSRSGRTEEEAIEALAAYHPRYGVVAKRAGLAFPSKLSESFDVVESLKGDATTDFGAPGALAKAESQPTTAAQARRLAALVSAAWAELDETAGASPAELRKGPRGGGRDRDKMIVHVLDSDAAYARKLGIKLKPPAIDDLAGIGALREAIVAVLAAPSDGRPLVDRGWPVRYAARRIAWHVLDHCWEMSDRSG